MPQEVSVSLEHFLTLIREFVVACSSEVEAIRVIGDTAIG